MVNQVRLVSASIASNGNVRTWLLLMLKVWIVLARLCFGISRMWLLSKLSQSSLLKLLKKSSGSSMIWLSPRKRVVRVFLKLRK